jgi:hypothetical protein
LHFFQELFLAFKDDPSKIMNKSQEEEKQKIEIFSQMIQPLAYKT